VPPGEAQQQRGEQQPQRRHNQPPVDAAADLHGIGIAGGAEFAMRIVQQFCPTTSNSRLSSRRQAARASSRQ